MPWNLRLDCLEDTSSLSTSFSSLWSRACVSPLSCSKALMWSRSSLACDFKLFTSSTMCCKVWLNLPRPSSIFLRMYALWVWSRSKTCEKRWSRLLCVFCINTTQSSPQGPGFGSTSIHTVSNSTERKYSTDSEVHTSHENSSVFTLLAVYLYFVCDLAVFLFDTFLVII